jgi:hypothetical protein
MRLQGVVLALAVVGGCGGWDLRGTFVGPLSMSFACPGSEPVNATGTATLEIVDRGGGLFATLSLENDDSDEESPCGFQFELNEPATGVATIRQSACTRGPFLVELYSGELVLSGDVLSFWSEQHWRQPEKEKCDVRWNGDLTRQP